MHWKSTALWGGKKVELRQTQRAVTPYGGLVVFFEFLRQVGYREAVSQHLPFRLTSPNAIDPVETFTAFLLSVVAGARRFAHTSLLRADVALHALLGWRAFPSTTPFATCSSASARGSASAFSLACGVGSSGGFRNVQRGTVSIWIPQCLNATVINKERCADPTRASMDGLRIIPWWRCWRKHIFSCTAGCAVGTAVRHAASWSF